MKIYTKKGDDGSTSLFGGTRLSKDDARIEAYGTVDELNAFLGQLADQVGADVQIELRQIQSLLFNLGACLATVQGKESPARLPSPDDTAMLEDRIDEMESGLPDLRNFILPGGHPTVSAAHICRTVCRRAERRVVHLSNAVPVDPAIVVYLNRLSDYLFVLGRKLASDVGASEVPWINRN